ncbi:hypothetical protein LJC58_10500, partial [Lachnospiraceae bacterium OttesenSCG-928-D06]|nr:hypothetical protein [Lachnospiraceae bacterium OttesenSCG-928-D06]
LGKRRIVGRLLQDFTSYIMPQLMLKPQLAGDMYASYTPGNYEIMKRNTPGLTKEYVRYGCFLFQLVIILGIILWGLLWFTKRKERNIGESRGNWRIILFISLFIGVYYTMEGAGMMDYKNTIMLMIFWFAWLAQASLE